LVSSGYIVLLFKKIKMSQVFYALANTTPSGLGSAEISYSRPLP
jgi:hypothetical protein